MKHIVQPVQRVGAAPGRLEDKIAVRVGEFEDLIAVAAFQRLHWSRNTPEVYRGQAHLVSAFIPRAIPSSVIGTIRSGKISWIMAMDWV